MGTIQFDVCVRYLKEDPWERVRLIRQEVTAHAVPLADPQQEHRQRSISCPTT